jgi:hypothetical protein
VDNVSPLERRSENAGENGVSLTKNGENGEPHVSVSEEEKVIILTAAYSQLQVTNKEKVNRTKLMDALHEMDEGWNNKSWNKIKSVLDDAGL